MNIRTKSSIIPVITIVCLNLAAPLFAAHERQPHFAEPFSGKRVQSYQITLPLNRAENATYKVPEECSKITAALVNGAGHWGGRIERRLWQKVNDDCHYHGFLNQNRTHAEHDAVSGYDFMNARFSDLPLNPECDATVFMNNPLDCPPTLTGTPNFARFLSAPSEIQRDSEIEQRDCRFHDGVFRGYIFGDRFGLRCVKNKRAPGFRIFSVDYTDINGDGYQDVILRLIPIGPGVSPVPTLLPLTRSDEGEIFTIPEGVELPRFGPGTPLR